LIAISFGLSTTRLLVVINLTWLSTCY